jgi:hypothetical protein
MTGRGGSGTTGNGTTGNRGINSIM